MTASSQLPQTILCIYWYERHIHTESYNGLTNSSKIPRRGRVQHPNRACNSDPWVRVSFKVNAFTSTEWPPRELSELDKLSIGEEQSPSTIVSLSWSPLGLARHRRSALAILTTNHVLSLWASNSNPAAAPTWHRVLIINNVLPMSTDGQSSDGDHGLQRQISRHSARIRSMSWAPPKVYNSQQVSSVSQLTQSHSACPIQYLAVTNDADGIAILHIRSPWSQNGDSWEGQVMHTINWGELMNIADSAQHENVMHHGRPSNSTGQECQPFSLYASSVAKKTFIDQVTCISSETAQSAFGLIVRKNKQSLRFEYLTGVTPEHHVRFPSFNCGGAVYTAKMPDSPSYIAVANNESDIELLSCGTSGGEMDNTQALSSLEVAPTHLSLVDEWDEISGLAFVNTPGALVLQASGLLAGSFAVRVVSHRGEDSELLVPYRSALQVQISRLQNEFDRHHDLGGLGYTKTWGLASWGSYVASCITMHPGDMVEYTLTSEQRCRIVFSREDTSNDLEDDAIFPWQVPYKEMHQQAGPAVLDDILSVLTEIPRRHRVAGRKTLYSICCAAMICPDVQNWSLVNRLLQDLSMSVGISYDSELSLLQSLNASRMSMLERAKELNGILIARIEQQDLGTLNFMFEYCSICEQLIVWRDLNEAYCVSGHQFARCGLTLSPITVPGISKSCETCHREFIDEAQLTQMLSDNGIPGEIDSQEPRPPADDGESQQLTSDLNLTNKLFEQFSICPYCGGKYIS
ncbi:MAG: hypothetical protein Q9169_002420 [Polycauliona sp. 2 TL-2023]